MQGLVLLVQVEDAVLGAPVVGGLELEGRALGVARVEGDALALLHVQAGDPHVVVDDRGVYRGEVLHYLQGHEPGVHQQSASFIDSPDPQCFIGT